MLPADAQSDLDLCSIHHWFPHLRATSIRTTLIPLDAAFTKYLTTDGVFVPDAGDADDDASSDGHDDSAWDESDDAEAEATHERFPALEEAITAAITKHGGACFPKLNWSAPSDAAWVLGGSLKCASARDVLLLLKSSDRIAHDLCEARRGAYGGPIDESTSFPWTLALRSWCNLRPSSEFRCFGVAHGAVLVAACQRDRFSHYPFLEAARSAALEQLTQFATRAFGGGGSAVLPVRVVWDAYIDANDKVHLIDVAPFEAATDPLLFEWDELTRLADLAEACLAGAADAVELLLEPASAAGDRVVLTLHAIQPTAATGATPLPAELRLTPEYGVAPSAQMYYGWPQELREVGGSDIGTLLEAARAASLHATASKAQGG